MITAHGSDTVRIEMPRLLPPLAPDRRDRVRLTRRGRIVRDLLAGASVLGLAVLADPISHAIGTFVVFVAPFVPGSVL